MIAISQLSKRMLFAFSFTLLTPLSSTVTAATTDCDSVPTSEETFCLLSDLGGCDELEEFLANRVADTPTGGIWPGTLIVDRACNLQEAIVLPRRMTLAGVGIGGSGTLSFPDLAPGQAAIAIKESTDPDDAASVTVRDLAIYGPNADSAQPAQGIGLLLRNSNQVILHRVSLSGFNIGVLGRNSFSVSIAHSNVSTNNTNLRLDQFANGWRVRDSILSQANNWSVYVFGGNDVLLDGNRLESNAAGGILVRSDSTLIANNRFENNGYSGGWAGVRIDPIGTNNRVLTNYFSTSTTVDMGTDTLCYFNIADPGLPFVC